MMSSESPALTILMIAALVSDSWALSPANANRASVSVERIYFTSVLLTDPSRTACVQAHDDREFPCDYEAAIRSARGFRRRLGLAGGAIAASFVPRNYICCEGAVHYTRGREMSDEARSSKLGG